MAVGFTATFLGTGTSTGVPMMGCDCPVCTSDDPRDARMRPSLLVAAPGGNILVDAGPEMRLQLLRAGVGAIEAVLVTHSHADHIFGMDDLRQFNFRHGKHIPVYGSVETLERLRHTFDYCFRETQPGGGKPRLELVEVTPFVPFALAGLTVTPLPVWHGRMEVLAFRFDAGFVYCTDVSAIPDATRPHLHGLDVLTLGAVRVEPPSHPSHFILPEALAEFADLAPRQGYLTHLSHHFHHATVSATLPPGVALAHDGLTLTFGEDG